MEGVSVSGDGSLLFGNFFRFSVELTDSAVVSSIQTQHQVCNACFNGSSNEQRFVVRFDLSRCCTCSHHERLPVSGSQLVSLRQGGEESFRYLSAGWGVDVGIKVRRSPLTTAFSPPCTER